MPVFDGFVLFLYNICILCSNEHPQESTTKFCQLNTVLEKQIVFFPTKERTKVSTLLGQIFLL